MLEALLEAVKIFKKHRLDYCLIGGLAMLLHNGRANTVDIDFYVLVNDLDSLIKILKKEKIFTRTAGEYQVKAKIGDVPIDILLADHYIGHEVVQRAVEKKLGNHFVRIATPEDIIVLKTLADRSVDRRDIEELRELFKDKLDEDYIRKKLSYLEKMLNS